VVIGGLITSTLLTLVMLPTLYHWFEERHVET
jgi:cobalt-zinc-cadmium resistance protein CzcA